jgi:NAD(P)H-hydrate epimerase
MAFQREDGLPVPAVTADEMRRVDTLAVEAFGMGILQMMEHAGRALAEHVLLLRAGRAGPVVVLAGPGGNGGGGLCCARHLHNRGVPTAVALDRPVEALRGPAAAQMRALRAAGLQPLDDAEVPHALAAAGIVVDALFLADIGIPPALYRGVGLDAGPIFGERWWVPLRRVD